MNEYIQEKNDIRVERKALNTHMMKMQIQLLSLISKLNMGCPFKYADIPSFGLGHGILTNQIKNAIHNKRLDQNNFPIAQGCL